MSPTLLDVALLTGIPPHGAPAYTGLEFDRPKSSWPSNNKGGISSFRALNSSAAFGHGLGILGTGKLSREPRNWAFFATPSRVSPIVRLSVVNPSSRYYRIRRRLSNEKRRRKVRRSWINFLVLGLVRLSFSIVASSKVKAFEALFYRGSVPLPGKEERFWTELHLWILYIYGYRSQNPQSGFNTPNSQVKPPIPVFPPNSRSKPEV